MSSVPYLLIKRKCEQVFKGKYQIYDEDVIYDTMTSIICQYIKSHERIQNLEAWLVGAIHHHFCAYVANKNKKKIFTYDQFLEHDDGRNMFIDNKLDVDFVKRQISMLKSPYQEIMTLRLIEDYSHKEISDRLGVNEATVRKYYSRSIKKIAKLFTVVSQILMTSYLLL